MAAASCRLAVAMLVNKTDQGPFAVLKGQQCMPDGSIDPRGWIFFFPRKNKVTQFKLVLGCNPQHVLLLPGLYVGEGQLPKLKPPASRSAI